MFSSIGCLVFGDPAGVVRFGGAPDSSFIGGAAFGDLAGEVLFGGVLDMSLG